MDVHGRMPGQLEREVEQDQPDYHGCKAAAVERIKAMLGWEVIRHKQELITWTIIDGWDPEMPSLQDMQQLLGLLSFDMKDYTQ